MVTVKSCKTIECLQNLGDSRVPESKYGHEMSLDSSPILVAVAFRYSLRVPPHPHPTNLVHGNFLSISIFFFFNPSPVHFLPPGILLCS